MSDEVENMARTLCNDTLARSIAKAMDEPDYDNSSDTVKAYWRAVAKASHAPALLEALEAMIDAFAVSDDEPSTQYERRAVTKARAAIAAAKGGE